MAVETNEQARNQVKGAAKPKDQETKSEEVVVRTHRHNTRGGNIRK